VGLSGVGVAVLVSTLRLHLYVGDGGSDGGFGGGRRWAWYIVTFLALVMGWPFLDRARRVVTDAVYEIFLSRKSHEYR
jgi:hypothetical protein